MKTDDGWEKLAFQFCKVATFALVFQKFTFIAASAFAAITYWVVVFRGVKSTRCWLQKPLLVACVWTVLCPIAIYCTWFYAR